MLRSPSPAPASAEADTPPSKPPVSTRSALVFVYAGYMLRYAYLLVLIPFYGRVLGVEEYGRLLAAMSLMQMVWLLVEFGFPIAGARDTAATRDRGRVAEILGQQLAGRFTLVAPAILIGVAGTLLSPVLAANPWFGIVATISGVLAAFNLGWHFQGRHRFRTSMSLELLGFSINLPLILLLVKGPGDGVLVMQILLFSGAVSTVVGYTLALRGLDVSRIRLRRPFELIRGSVALFATNGLTAMMASSSTFVLSLFAPAAVVGWYGAAERLITVGLGLLQPAKQVLISTLSRALAHPDTEGASWQLMRRSVVGISALGVTMMLGTLAVAHFVVPFIFGPGFEPTVHLLMLMALLLPLAAFCEAAVGYVLIPLREDMRVSLTSLVGASATVLMLFALVPQFSAMGAVTARILGYVAMATVLLAILLRRKLIHRMWTLQPGPGT